MLQANRSFLEQNKKIILALIILLIYVLPYFILGQNAHMRVLDNLDSNLAWYKVLAESHTLFAPLNTTIPQVINGLPRADYYSQFYGYVLLSTYLPPMLAYGLNELITRIFAFIGMYLLLKDYVVKERKWDWIRVGAALTFALTPFWPSGMLSQLGMPLALWAFLNIRAGSRSWKNVAVITLLPFYSTFVLGFFFFLSALGVFWLIDAIRNKKWNLHFLISIAYMTIIYLFVEYRLVFSMLTPHAPTSRVDFKESKLSFSHTIILFFKNLLWGHNQDPTIHTPVITGLVIFAFIIIWRKKLWQQEKMFVWLSIFYAVLSLWYAFWFYQGWEPLKEKFTILTTFNFSRYHYFHPMVIYAMFALSLRILWQNGKTAKKMAKVLVIAQIIILFGCNEQIRYHNQPTYKQFFAVKQFNAIKSYIGKPVDSYRVASIGIHPDIAQYNGLYTLDTYNNFYPLTYKRHFRKIIAKELAKNHTIRTYFDDWGSRCYLFTAQLGKHYMFTKQSTVHLKHLELNLKPFKEMGGQYILSAVPIDHPERTGLTFKKAFNSSDSAWKIYLYEVSGKSQS